MHTKEKEYIGDGVYIEVEAGMVKLTTERHDGTHTIYLEPSVYQALVQYVSKVGGEFIRREENAYERN